MGPEGPPGPSGALTQQSRSWVTSNLISTASWTTIPGSQFTATTSGGTLMIHTNISAIGNVSTGSSFTCRPTIDEVWAGTFGGLPGTDPWNEGVADTRADWVKWTGTRLYTDVPPGQHTFAVQCFVNNGTLRVGSTTAQVVSSWGFVELD